MLLSYILKMKKRQRPSKIADLMDTIWEALDSGRYVDMVHAQERQLQRNITRPEYTYVLRHGYHEARKDTFEEPYNAWNYAIRGKTLDKRDLRVIVSFDDSGMLIITTIEVHK
jgi:hypothetical protein